MRDLRTLVRYVSWEWAKRLGITPDMTSSCLMIPSPVDRKALRLIATSGGGWDHVSVSRADRCPWWEEMDHIKRIVFLPDEVVMQLHVGAADHVNIHPYTLHLWRPLDRELPLPPQEYV